MPANDSELQSGYDLPVYGLADGSFYTLHIIAISCNGVSLTCAAVTLIMSLVLADRRGFFATQQKRERFIVYMALCDGLFNACHSADHLHVLIAKDHVHPKGLCVFYAFDLLVTIMAQNLLVNLVAVNAFALMYFDHNLNFGRWDWRLLLWIFGVPFICAIISIAADRLGPNGAYCLFDGVNGSVFYLVFIAVPVIVILLMNTTLYLLTWLKLYTQTKAIRRTVGPTSAGMRAAHRAARSMALFVVAYIVQWWALALSGFWAASGSIIPQEMIQMIVFFSNIGGLLNLVVFIIIRRSKTESSESQVHYRTSSGTDIPKISGNGFGTTATVEISDQN